MIYVALYALPPDSLDYLPTVAPGQFASGNTEVMLLADGINEDERSQLMTEYAKPHQACIVVKV